ncbi:MAG: SMC-Scp complex subunit ScpB, partial [Candidatus Devosia euplotis]|nr:SMC-Scp complex subunit ScpB [Candidatus Devosia euplotis]
MNGSIDEPQVSERHLRVLEAVLFASTEPLDAGSLLIYVGEGVNIANLLAILQQRYAGRGVNLVRRGNKWAFRTAEDLGFLLRREERETRPLSRAALETLSIIAYH